MPTAQRTGSLCTSYRARTSVSSSRATSRSARLSVAAERSRVGRESISPTRYNSEAASIFARSRPAISYLVAEFVTDMMNSNSWRLSTSQHLFRSFDPKALVRQGRLGWQISPTQFSIEIGCIRSPPTDSVLRTLW